MARHLPVPGFNSIVGLRAGEEDALEPLVAWYRENEVKPRVEMVPGLADAKLARELSRLGFFHSGFQTSLICDPANVLPSEAAVPINLVSTPDMLETFLDTHAAGWGIPDPAGFKVNVSGWLGLPGWTLYLAHSDGRPAATAILYIADRVGYCADAATRPEFRGRGLQTALLRRRIADARAAGVDFVCSGTDYASTSHRNMERVGMRVQFVRALWTQL